MLLSSSAEGSRYHAAVSLPDGYVELLIRLARAFATYRHRTKRKAVVVGGTAAALYTDGAFMTGVVDIVATDDTAFHEPCGIHADPAQVP